MRTVVLAIPFLCACASSLSMSDQKLLREAAARDHECTASEVQLTGEVVEKGKPTRYVVDACGRERKYVKDEHGNFVDSSMRAGEHERRDDSRERLDHAPPEEE
jgi:hypothetical protein